ncbi:MAG TPA: hypothetical protein VIF62_04740 [Labilithrix sp.]
MTDPRNDGGDLDIGRAMNAAPAAIEKRTEQSASPLRTWLGRLAPWILAVLVLVALLHKYDPALVAAQMRAGSWAAMAPLAMVPPFYYLLVHGLCDTVIFRTALGSNLRWRDVVRGRSGTAMLMLLGYVFGNGAMGVWLARRTGAKARTVTGAVLYGMLSDLAAVSLVTAVSTFLAEIPSSVRILALVLAAIPIALALVGPTVFARTTAPFLAAWRVIPGAIGVAQIVGRALDIAVVVVIAWSAARAFGMPIPLAAFAAYMPVILLASSLPISVAGFGAAQAAWLVFLPWAPGEQILAFQLLWQLFFGLGLVLRGAPFVRGVVREIRGT